MFFALLDNKGLLNTVCLNGYNLPQPSRKKRKEVYTKIAIEGNKNIFCVYILNYIVLSKTKIERGHDNLTIMLIYFLTLKVQ